MRWPLALQLIVVFAAYFAAGKVGLAVPFTSGNVSPVWPPAGIALAALLLVGPRVWPAIAAGAFLVNLLTPISAGAAAALAAGNTAGPVLGAWLLRRVWTFHPTLRGLHDVLGLILVAAPASAAASATVGVSVLFLTGVDPWVRFWPAWIVWWLGDGMGMLVVTPLILTAFEQFRIPGLRRLLELAVMTTGVTGTCLLVFGHPAGLGEKDVLVFAVLPFVLWGATRFQLAGAAGVSLLIACIAIWETAEGAGPFVRNSTLENATTLQAFLAVISVSGLTLAAAIAERAQLIRREAQREGRDALNSNVLLSSAVEQTADSVLICDSHGRIQYVNPAFEKTTGYAREEAVGKTPRLLKSGHHAEEFYRDMWGRLLRGEPYGATLVNRRKTGELYWADQTITPIKEPGGTVTHFVAVLKDVTEARKYHEQEVKLRLARAVQQRFYPSPPRLSDLDIGAASFPADHTGGDYYDFIEAPNGVWYLAIGDVSGHGFDAALIMALARAYTRSFATLDMEVGEVLARVNRAILGDLEANRYVTMLLVRIDTQARCLAYASAGHIAGVLLDTGGRPDWTLDSTGVPLGLFAGSAFGTRQFGLRPGQILVLGTDGATETCNPAGEEFGLGRVMQYVRSHTDDAALHIAVGMYGAARSFAASAAQQDDITSLIVKVI